MLSPFDPHVTGVLSEAQLEQYIGAQAQDTHVLDDMDVSFRGLGIRGQSGVTCLPVRGL